MEGKYEIRIKNMVCPRCVASVKSILENIGIVPVSVALGVAYVAEIPDSGKMRQLKCELEKAGFELIGDRQEIVLEQIRTAVIELVHYEPDGTKQNLSSYISGKLHSEYGALSKLFTRLSGMTIETYFILQKIEKVKELLEYGQLTVSEIAYRLNYSSAAHLSSQFRKVTGMTPTRYRAACMTRKPIDEL